MNLSIEKYFGFLSDEMGFNGPFEYSFVRQLMTDFIKDKVIVSISYDGDYCVNIFKTSELIPELLTGELRTIDLNAKQKTELEFDLLDSKRKLWNSVSNENFPDKKLWYYFRLIQLNPEVLVGNFEKTEFLYRLKQKFKKLL